MDSISIGSIARVSAVLLLVGLVWCKGVWGEDGSRRWYAQQAQPKMQAGAGTETGLQQGDSKVRAESPGASTKSEARETSGAMGEAVAVFRDVAAGWRTADPKPFEKYLRKGKVRLDFGEGGPRGGLFAKSQAYYLIADYLKGTQTIDIDLVKFSDGSKNMTRPYALIERVFRDRDGMQRKEVVFVSLILEDSSWAIAEVRAISAK